MTILLNEVMKLERAAAHGAGPYQPTDNRNGYAKGFKPKILHTRLGALTVAVPQTRRVEFYPSALQKGVRSVSTRKAATITEQLCGLEVTSGQVSRAAQALHAELEKVRTCPLGATPCLILNARYEKVRDGGSVVSCAVLVGVGIDQSAPRARPRRARSTDPDSDEISVGSRVRESAQ